MNPHNSAASTLIILGLLVTLCYAVGCWIWPFANCPRCHGTGKRRSPSGRAFRLCRRCDGTGRRLRVGRWIYNQLRGIHKDGTR
jgi:hypothetical protein